MKNHLVSIPAVLLGILLATAPPAYAATTDGLQTSVVRLSRSIEGPGILTPSEEALSKAPLQPLSPLEQGGSRVAPSASNKTALPRVASTGQTFWIYDAMTRLSGDIDGDGFYHQIDVTFDADVDFGTAAVYARLFVSYEGGPWNHYFTTDVFFIDGDSTTDLYTVSTHLLEGYPTGYYDVLIELYEASWDEFVADYGPFEDPALRVLPLEDLARDDYYTSDGGGGAFDLYGVIGLLGLLFVRRVAGKR